MLVERVGHGAYRFVVRKRNGFVALPFALPLRPSAVQGVLKNRKLVGIVAHIVDQPREKSRVDFAAAHSDGSADRSSPLFARETRNQKLSLIHRLGKAGKARAIAEEVGAHGQDHEDGVIRFGGLQQQIHECNGRFMNLARLLSEDGGLWCL